MDLARLNGNVLIGVIHLPALPGAPKNTLAMSQIVDEAVRDAEILSSVNFDGVLVENFGDVPFFRNAVPGETIAAMAVVCDAVRRASRLPLGVNVLRNDATAAVSIAVAAGASFVRVNVLVGARVTDQGVIESDAARVLRHRTALRAHHVGIIADVDVKHSAALAPWSAGDEALEATERAMADVVIVTGSRTGAVADPLVIDTVRASVPGVPIWLGSGVKPERLGSWFQHADGAIVGTALRANGRAGGAISREHALRFVDARQQCLRVEVST